MDLRSHLAADTDELFGPLTPQTPAKALGAALPVMATPAAVAAGVATVGAFVAGYAVEEAGDS